MQKQSDVELKKCPYQEVFGIYEVSLGSIPLPSHHLYQRSVVMPTQFGRDCKSTKAAEPYFVGRS